MNNTLNLFLIGYRATGKTTVAGHLAKLISWPWVDADDEIEALAEKTIVEIFENEGEAAFRKIETEVVAELSQREKCIISLGGGAVVAEENRKFLKNRGMVIWLTAKPETICTRMINDDASDLRRPNLTPRGPETEVLEILSQREPIYRQCADLIVDTENRTPAEIAAEIATAIVSQIPPTSDKTDTS